MAKHKKNKSKKTSSKNVQIEILPVKPDNTVPEESSGSNVLPEQRNELEVQHPALVEFYHDLSNLGRGSQATMIKALDKNNKPVAIKVFDLKNTDDWKSIELFEREIHVIKNLHVYGVPGYIDTIKTDDYLYLVEEYIDAISLEKQLENGRIFTLDESLKIFEHTAAILKDLGECDPPVVHRDVKPANLLVDDKLNVYLVDFGVVAKNTATFSMTFAGTAGYVAPEQLYGQATTASDIFSLGATMLHLMTGVSPCDMKLKGISPDIDRYMPTSVPTWISVLIKQMMAVKPGQRPQSGAELMDLIEKGKSTGSLVFDQSNVQELDKTEKKHHRYKTIFGIIYAFLWILYLFILPSPAITVNTGIGYHSIWLFVLVIGGAWGFSYLKSVVEPKPKFITSDEELEIESDYSKDNADLSEEQESQPEHSPKISLNSMDCIPSLSLQSESVIFQETPSSPQISIPELSTNIVELMQKAKNGDSDAMVSLGYKYHNGYGVEQDSKQAYDWWYKAAELGNSIAMYDLGILNEHGFGVPVNMRQALVWFKKSAELGYSSAQNALAKMYHDGTCVDRDDKEALEWAKKAATSGNAEAETLVGMLYDGNGQGINKDVTEAMSWYLKGAQHGSAYAMYCLGYNYVYGIGTRKNIQEGLKWYEKAAANGSTNSMIELGKIYEAGVEVARDYQKAMDYYESAALKGNSSAQISLANCYYRGVLGEIDYHKAEVWYIKAAESGESVAMSNLGVLYYYRQGNGYSPDYHKAYDWFNKAALLGDVAAQNFLGVLYSQGRGVNSDLVKAAYWFQKAADQGDAIAQYNLGTAYKNGRGISRNKKLATYWLQKAADQGDKDAIRELGR